MRRFVIYVGDKADKHIDHIRELSNAKLHEHWGDRITAFRQANKITDRSTCILIQDLVLQSGQLFVINQGNGRNIQREEDLNTGTNRGAVLLAKPNNALLAGVQ